MSYLLPVCMSFIKQEVGILVCVSLCLCSCVLGAYMIYGCQDTLSLYDGHLH